MAEPIGALRANLSASSAAFESDMNAARDAVRNSARDMKSSMGGVKTSFDAALKTMFSFRTAAAAAAGIGGLAYLVKQSIDVADQLAKLSQSSGVSTQSLSTLGYAADLSGVNLESLSLAMKKLSKNMSDAAQGTGEAKPAFDALGISVKNADGTLKNADQAMLEIATKFERMQDGAGKTAIAMSLFGKSGGDLVPLLNAGGDGIKKMQDEARALGLELDAKTGQSAERFNDNITRLIAVKSGWVNKIRDAVLPILDTLSARLVESAKKAKETEESNGALTRSLKGLATAGVVVVGAVHLMLQAFATLHIFLWDTVVGTFETVGGLIGGSMASITEAIQGNFSASKAIWELTWNDYAEKADKGVKEAARNFVDGLKDMLGLDQKYTKLIIDMWNNSLDEVVEKAEDAGPKLAAPMIGAKKQIVEAENKIAESIEKTIAALGLQVATLGATERESALLKITIQGATKAQLEYADALLEIIESQKEQNKLIDEGKRIAESVRTPYEQYAETVAVLGNLLETGAISQETFNRAVAKAIGEAEKGFGDIKDKGKSDLDELKSAIDGWGKDSARAFADFAMSGKNSFGDLINSMIRDMITMFAYQRAIGPLFSAIGGAFSGGGGPVQLSGPGLAGGGSIGPGELRQVNERGPELLSIGSRQFLMMGGQHGQVTPASDGGAVGGGGRMVVEIRNDSKAQVSEGRSADGSPDIRVMIDDAVGNAIMSGRGKTFKAMRRQFGASPTMAGR